MFTRPSEHRISPPSSSEPASESRRRSPIKAVVSRVKKVLTGSHRNCNPKAKNGKAQLPPQPESESDSQPLLPANGLDRSVEAEVEKTPWYLGCINGKEAERILQPFPDGAFVLRRSSTAADTYSLTYREHCQCRSLRLERDACGNFSLNPSQSLQLRDVNPVRLLEDVVKRQCGIELERSDGAGRNVVIRLRYPVAKVRGTYELANCCPSNADGD
eukprot:m.4203 g.4203  ORF g.4203 m.4203 type:complete len:216 (+) comp10382_c0_seq1:166-813(+)